MQSDWARCFANYNRLMNERLYEHQTHHRGQLTTLLSQRGIDPGVTDLVAFASFTQSESTLSR